MSGCCSSHFWRRRPMQPNCWALSPRRRVRFQLQARASRWVGPARELRTTTDEKGAYRFPGLDGAGRLSLEVNADGFRPFKQDDIQLSAESRRVDIRLELADVRESIVVDGGVVSLGSNSPNVSQTVSGKQLGDLPSNRGV